MSLFSLISNKDYRIYNLSMAKDLGLNESILLSELCHEYTYWEENGKLDNGWFFSTADNLYDNTSLSAKQQRTALKHLEELGFIKIQRRGVPCKNYFFIFERKLENYLLQNVLITKGNTQLLQKVTTACDKREQLDVTKGNGNNSNTNSKNSSNTNIYTEAKASVDKNKPGLVFIGSEAEDQPGKKENIYIQPVKNLTTKEHKHKYGTYKHVSLSDTEFNNLCSEFGEQKIKDYINYLDEGIELKGYKYKNYELALRQWINNDKKGYNSTTSSHNPNRTSDSFEEQRRVTEADYARDENGNVKVY